ncbi:MAG: thioredoxin domain-containing protein [Bacteroidota bacterium]|nr:thioredoxin domain-containing protein [Bacteroidota bacterium]
MKFLKLIILIGIHAVLFSACSSVKKEQSMNTSHKHTNQLINSDSPYLLQHAHNPVDWYPWGDEAMNKAKKENKLMLISIGYSSCHWCHVMEHESFEDEETAKLMNENFICIKVDREQRPDIDNYYMDAVNLITGQGGWPLNCFALPDGRPFFGGTYFPNGQWKQILKELSNGYIKDSARYEKAASQIEAGIKQHIISGVTTAASDYSESDFLNAAEKIKSSFDKKDGGTEGAPKFPMPGLWEAMLNAYHHTGDQELLEQVSLTLNKMADGGIYDHLEGGFARYSTDKKWKAPHFEKMLYDNGQLLSLYSNTYKITGNEKYKTVVYQTIEFIKNKMTDKSNGFYSAYDADSEGVEGKYYVWTAKEIDRILGEDAKLFKAYYSVKPNGNWEHGNNILLVKKTLKEIADNSEITELEAERRLEKSRKQLLAEREKRIAPGLDDKIIVGWNALTIKGLTDSYQAFGEQKFLDLAKKNAQFIINNMLKNNGALLRIYRNGNKSTHAFMDDYALLIDAFTALYEVTGEESYYKKAILMTDYTFSVFFSEKEHLFYYSARHGTDVRIRKFETSDNVIPGSNSVMAKNLYRLYALGAEAKYKETSEKMLARPAQNINSNLRFFSNWYILASYSIFPFYELAVVGKDAPDKVRQLQKEYYPNMVYAVSQSKSELPLLKNRFVKGETLLYLCEDRACKMPVKTPEEIQRLLQP